MRKVSEPHGNTLIVIHDILMKQRTIILCYIHHLELIVLPSLRKSVAIKKIRKLFDTSVKSKGRVMSNT